MLTESEWTPVLRRAYLGVAAALVLLVALCGVRTLVGGWRPTGDDAFLALRARDVLSTRPPLLSTASSGGASAGVAYNHPGAAVLYLLAPSSLLVGGAGIAVGAAVLNAACVGLVAWLARRAARPALAAGVLAGVAGVAWAMGSVALSDPWNPNQATLLLAVALVGAWATWCGVPAAVPVALGAAALAAQTHLSFVPPAAAAAVLVLVGARAGRRRAGHDGERPWRRAWRIGAVVSLVAVLPVLVEQAARGRDGNLARILRGSRFDTATVPVGDSLGVLARVLVRPPFFLGGSWDVPVFTRQLPGRAASVVGLAVLVALGVAAVVLARRRGDRPVVAGLASAGVVLAVGAAASLRFPLRVGVPVPYYRWAWPCAGLVVAALVVPIVEAGLRRAGRPASWAAVGLLVVAAVSGVGAVVAASDAFTGSPVWAQRMVPDVVDPVVDVLRDGPPVEVVAAGQESSLVLTPALVQRLLAAGVDAGSVDPVVVQQAGERHRATGREGYVVVPVGPDVDAGPARGRRLARSRPPSVEERRRLARLESRAVARLRSDGLVLTAAGRAAPDDLPRTLVGLARTDPAGLVRNRFLSAALRAGLVDVPGGDDALVVTASDRLADADARSLSYWLVPRAVWERAGH